jgi:hypothetical protein
MRKPEDQPQTICGLENHCVSLCGLGRKKLPLSPSFSALKYENTVILSFSKDNVLCVVLIGPYTFFDRFEDEPSGSSTSQGS